MATPTKKDFLEELLKNEENEELECLTINKNTRNIGIIAHVDAGKTTTTERFLGISGAIKKEGEVHDGNATMDFLVQEKRRGITIKTSSGFFSWEDSKIFLLDTPGHVDFSGEVGNSLKISDGAIVLLDGSKGIETQTLAVIKEAMRNKISFLVFCNKMDKLGANFEKSYISFIKNVINPDNEFEVFEKGYYPLKIAIPYFFKEEEREIFLGCIDLITMKLNIWENDTADFEIINIPDDYIDIAKKEREKMLEDLCFMDEGFHQRYLENQIDENFLYKSIRRLCIEMKLVPFFPGSSFKRKCVQFVLDAICLYLPSPFDKKGVQLYKEKEPVKILLPTEKVFYGLVFKKILDKFSNNLYFVRIYSGEIESGETVYCVNNKKIGKVIKIYKIFVNEKIEIKKAFSGDIVAIAFDKSFVKIGFTINKNEFEDLCLESINYAKPLLSQIFIYHKNTDKEIDLFKKNCKELEEEDQSIRCELLEGNKVKFTAQGALQLEIIQGFLFERLLCKKEELTVEDPIVEYNERFEIGTDELIEVIKNDKKSPVFLPFKIDNDNSIEHELAKQTGGRGQYAKIFFKIKPLPENSGIILEETVKGADIKREQVTEALEAFKAAAEYSGLYGRPVTDFKVTITGGLKHDVDSKAGDFAMCAREAFRSIVPYLRIELLEPFVSVKISIPENNLDSSRGNFTGVISQYVNSKRGNIINTYSLEGNSFYETEMPVASILKIVTDIRMITSGQGVCFTPVFIGFKKVSDSIVGSLIKEGKLFYSPIYSLDSIRISKEMRAVQIYKKRNY